MSKMVLKSAVVAINGTAISDHVSSVTIDSTFDEVDFTGFGATYREFGQGLGDATITLETFNDYDAGSIEHIFWPYSQNGGTFTVTVRPSNAAASDTNPVFTMTGRVFGFNPIAGAVGEANTTSIPIRNAGTAGLTRGTA